MIFFDMYVFRHFSNNIKICPEPTKHEIAIIDEISYLICRLSAFEMLAYHIIRRVKTNATYFPLSNFSSVYAVRKNVRRTRRPFCRRLQSGDDYSAPSKFNRVDCDRVFVLRTWRPRGSPGTLVSNEKSHAMTP